MSPKRESIAPELVRSEVARGRMIIPANINHTNLEPMCIGVASKCKINSNIGNSAVTCDIDGRTREAALLRQVRRRYGDGPLHRRRHSRHPQGDHRAPRPSPSAPCRSMKRSRACAAWKTSTRSVMLDVIEEQAEQGVDYMTIHAGVLVQYIPLTTQPRHRHRQPRRVDPGRVDGEEPQAELALRVLRGHLQDLPEARRQLLAGRRPAPRQPRRRQRRGAVRRTEDARRTHQDGLGVRRAGDDRGSRPHSDGPDRDAGGEGKGDVLRGAVLHPRAAGHRHRARLRPHHRRPSARP